MNDGFGLNEFLQLKDLLHIPTNTLSDLKVKTGMRSSSAASGGDWLFGVKYTGS